jgi:hypothetical protein
MNRIVSVCLLAILSITPALAASPSVSMPSFWRYAHPEAKALIGIEWNQIINSPIGQKLRQQIEAKAPGELGGAELIDRVGRIFITSPGSAPGDTTGHAPAVMAIQGDFDLTQIRELAAGSASGTDSYASIEIVHFQQSESTPSALALVSPQLLLLGDETSIRAAIDHYLAGDPDQASDPLFLHASELAAANDIWMVTHTSPSDFSQQGLEQAQFLNDVETIEAGLSLQSGLGLEVNLRTSNSQSAMEIASGLQMMLGMLLAAQSNNTGGPNLADKLDVAADDTTVRLALHLDDSEVEQAFSQMASSMASAGDGSGITFSRGESDNAGGWAGSQDSSVSGADTPPGTVTIWGLDDGPREVPLGSQ